MMTVTTAVTTKSSAHLSAAEQLTRMDECLSQHFATSPHDDIRSNDDSLTLLAERLSQHCHLASITTLLSSIIQSPKLLAEIAARSYWHGNGFLKVVLLDQGYKLRLHIWFAGTACEENIHSHRWGFASHVLTGSLKSELWTDAANDDLISMPFSQTSTPAHASASMLQAEEYIYTAKHQNGSTSILARKQFVGTTCLQKLQNVTQTAGASYVMTPDQLHRINHPGQELVATIICTAPTQVLTNRLFPTIAEPNLQPVNLSANELMSALSRYLDYYCIAA